MRRVAFVLAIVLGLCSVSLASEARAGCACTSVECNVTSSSEVEEVWRQHPDDPAYFGLYRGGVQIAGYDTRSRIYRSYDAAKRIWGPADRAPWMKECCACVFGCECGDNCQCSGGKRCVDECTCVAKTSAIPNYGVDLSRLNGQHEVVSLNGRKIPKELLPDILAGGQLVDDSGKPRLTVIGTDPERKRVLDDLNRPPLSEWKDQLLVQGYPPNHWTVTRSGFFSAGRPTIYLQTAGGKVLHRQDDYADGADGLAQAIRRADPSYDPKKDPDLRKLLHSPNFEKIPAGAWLLAAGILLGLLMKGKP
ncbi:hypothetical protein AYO40_00630 [Planctomycetaceae bacterium SCGC AG-212-D15]|nr:hypothetical protein AYO40_00630 [Planctomycetaceae bacterium SCGC AG-212-D15]